MSAIEPHCFKGGDIVRLNSGSPPLYVWGVDGDIADVLWLDGNSICYDALPIACLTPTLPPISPSQPVTPRQSND